MVDWRKMSFDELQAVVSQLDASLPHAEATVSIRQPSGPDECEIHGTRAGFARLGLEFLRASALPADQFDAGAIEHKLGQIIDDNSDVNFCWFERHETLSAKALPSGRPNRWRLVLVLGLLSLVLVTFVVGGIVIIEWAWRLLRDLFAGGH